jgi:hypothetical protein
MRNKVQARPQSEWHVLLRDQHPGYLSWQAYMANQQTLAQNQARQTMETASSPAREGQALLQGLLVCAKCGRRLSPRYGGQNGQHPTYECNWRRRELAERACQSVRADVVDAAVSARILSALVPAQLEIALAALQEVEQQDRAVEQQWKWKLERAEYDAQLAQRRFEEVDPANRLVAGSLERGWEQALERLGQARREYEQYRQQQAPALTPEQQAQVRQLATDLPQLWGEASTSSRDRKRILRLLIEDITVQRQSERQQAILHLRWSGGACEDLTIDLPRSVADRWRYPEEFVARVRAMAVEQTDQQIADALVREGIRSSKGHLFTASMVQWIRHKHRIAAPRLKRPDELTVQELSRKFGVNPGVVYYWLACGRLKGRRARPGWPLWISLTPQKEQELAEYVACSTRIPKTHDHANKS